MTLVEFGEDNCAGANAADLTFWESVVWSNVAFCVGSFDVAGAVCGSGMMRFSPGCRVASCDRSFAARMLLKGTS